MVRADDFDSLVPLPTDLSTGVIRKAVEYIERELGELVDLYFEQANVFSALVGIFGTRRAGFVQQLRETQAYRYGSATFSRSLSEGSWRPAQTERLFRKQRKQERFSDSVPL